MTKKHLIIGNWKMHLNVRQASHLVERLARSIKAHYNTEVVLAPGFVALQPLSLQIDRHQFRLAAQNAYHVDEGAYTGEISFNMLHNLVHYVIIGHSERRKYFNEDLDLVKEKVAACVRNEITPVLCVGETTEERANQETKIVIHDQISTAISDLTKEEIAKMVIAYEPRWAIGSGKPAMPAQINEAVDFIYFQIKQLHGEDIADQIRIIYGGSVEPDFAKSLLEIPKVEGFLVGGASLNYKKFASIIETAHNIDKGKPGGAKKQSKQK